MITRKILPEEWYLRQRIKFLCIIKDGFRPVVIDAVQNYQNEFSIKGNADDTWKRKKYTEIVFPLVCALAEEGIEYTGIFRAYVVITPNDEIYLIENAIHSFKDIDTRHPGTDVDWSKTFYGYNCRTG